MKRGLFRDLGIDHKAHKSIFLFCRRLMHVMGWVLIFEPSQCILQRENDVISGYSISYTIRWHAFRSER